jgi:hypothetical protein
LSKKSVELRETYINWDILATVYPKLGKWDEALMAAEKDVESKVVRIKKTVKKNKEKKWHPFLDSCFLDIWDIAVYLS